MIFINLSNGIEALAHFSSGVRADGFVRIQSSHLEGRHYSRVIEELDYNFMLAALMGREIFVVDAASRNPYTFSRAQWMGIPWICYFLDVHVKGSGRHGMVYSLLKPPFQNMVSQFDQVKLSDATKSRARYLKKFLNAYSEYPVTIKPWTSMRSTSDGRYLKLAAELKQHYKNTVR